MKVDYYGTPTDLKAIASISVPEATQILIKLFSPGDLKWIEKAINDSKLTLTPHSDGKQLRLILPPMSQETRLEDGGAGEVDGGGGEDPHPRARRDANKVVDTEEKGGVLTEDEAKGGEQVQELTKKYEAKVDEMTEAKRKEVMQV